LPFYVSDSQPCICLNALLQQPGPDAFGRIQTCGPASQQSLTCQNENKRERLYILMDPITLNYTSQRETTVAVQITRTCSFFVAVSRIALLPMGCFDTLLMVRASKTSEQTGAVSRSPCSSSHWVRASDMLTHACLPLLPFQRLPWNGESRQEKIGATRKTSSVDRLE